MKRTAITLTLLSVAVGAQAQGDPAVNQRIIDIGKNQNQVMNYLDHVTHKIGPRLTGSPNLQKAMDWAMAEFKKSGCTNVHLEEWGQWPVGFQRGKRQAGRMVSPWKLDFEFSSPSWTPGTDGPLRGPAVLAPATMDEFNAMKDKLKGAWVVVAGGGGGGRNAAPSELDNAINGAGILGRVSGARSDITLTGGSYRIEWDKLPTLRRVTIRKEDMDSVMAALQTNRPCELEFDMEQKFIKGPVKNCNVVAEIKGTEKPDEVVIVSGHLDSWDGPGSQGALDNGTGISVALEAARILGKAGAKPKRTIRFILWTGEEQGLFGSNFYVKAHANELDKISAVFVDDGGTNYEGGLTCTEDMAPMLREAQAPMTGVFPTMPFEIRIVPRIPRGGGSDHAPFNAAGVPGFFWFETGNSNYTWVHHTQNDRYEYAIPEYLIQSATNSAIMSYNLACAATLLPREPKPGG
ncbi:MAG: M20/M25/M40 family metallo-hydrolase [Fimbriimonadales bacterium]